MDDVFSKEENQKNIYVIRHKLAALKPEGGRYYQYHVGNYTLHIYTYAIQDVPVREETNLLKYEKVSVVLNETTKSGVTSNISLRDDPQFKNYEPIQYDIIETPNGKINLSNGDNMPIGYLCELIRYLHRLSNLTAFL
jgi:hypothetical protein